MLRNHPDKGGDKDRAAEVSALYSHAVGQDMSSGSTPSKAKPDVDECDPATWYRRKQQAARPHSAVAQMPPPRPSEPSL